MDAVTIVIVYQNSQPWFEVALRSLMLYTPGCPVEYLLVENPCKDSSPDAASGFVLGRGGAVILPHEQDKDRFGGGQNHADALEYALEYVATKWTLFMDADVICLRDNWLRDMLAAGSDMVGPPAFSNLYDYTIPHAHPCLLLFRTNLAREPYWTGTFSPTPNLPLGHREYRDTCIAFTEKVGRDPDLSLRRLPMEHIPYNGSCCYRISDIALHMTGTSNLDNRPRKYHPKREMLSMPEVQHILQATRKLTPNGVGQATQPR